MIDYIKSLHLNTDIKKILNNNNLEFEGKYNNATGEILENRQVAKYKNLTFEIVNKKHLNLSGSLHKYYNNGLHNYNDFSFSNLLDTMIELYQKFDINPLDIPLHNIEIGINVEIPEPPKQIIKHNIINYKGEPASIMQFQKKGYMKQFEKQQYYIKIYDKGKQYKLAGNILRFEIKVVKMEYLKKIKINTLADLLDLEKLKQLKILLLDKFNDLLMYDNNIRLDEVTSKQKEILLNGKNPKFWEQLKDYQTEKQRKKYYRELKKFKKLLHQKNATQIKNELLKLISEKCNELLRIDNKTRDKLTDFLQLISLKKGDKLTDFIQYSKKTKRGQINSSSIGLFCPQKTNLINSKKYTFAEAQNILFCSRA